MRAAVSTQEKKTKGMCIATRCTSVEQFIQMFHRFVDQDSFFVSTLNTRPPGLETSFSVQLVDGTPVLKGLCVVLQAWTDANNAFKTPGVRLGIKRLTANSMLVFEQLLVTRSAPKPPTTIAVGAGTPTVSAAPKPVAPIATKPLGSPAKPAVSVPKVITPLSGAVPRPIAKSPFAETAPTRLAPSRVELHQPARASSEAAVPEAVTTPETTDVIEEKTDVREPKLRLVPLPPGASDEAKPEAKAEAAPEQKPAAELAKVDAAESVPTPRLDTEGPTMERTPGSDLVLPANPLMNLTDESLEGYVDCTLYEETGNFFPVDEDASVIVDDVIPPPPLLAPRPVVARAPTPPPMGPNDRPPAKEFDEKSDSTELAAPRFQSSPGRPAYPAGATPPALPTVPQAGPRDSEPAMLVPPARDSVMVDPELVARGSTPAFEGNAREAERKPESIASRLPLSAEATPLPPPMPASDDYVITPPRAVPIAAVPAPRRATPWWLYASVGVLVAAGVGVFVMARGSSGASTAPQPTKPAKPVAEVTPPVPETQPEEPAKPSQPAGDPGDEPDEQAPGGGPPVVGGGPCKVVVATTPAGSIVMLDDKAVGPSPITVAASCDKHKLDISHPRYQSTTKLVTLAQGKDESLDVTLMRPTHTVTVNSTPSGATIYIDGRSAGTTPTKMSVLGFTTLKLEFKKTGYQPATKKLYSKLPQDTVSVRLNKW